MTVSANPSADLDIGRICLIAYRQATLINEYQSLDTQKKQNALDLLDVIVKSLASENGFPTRVVDFYNLTLVSGQYIYALPATTLDVIDTAMYLDPSQPLVSAASEVPVIGMSRERWQTQQTKAATGRPQFYYAHRVAEPVQVWLWPTPSSAEAAGHVRFQLHHLRASSMDATKTFDFENYWERYFIYQLASELSIGAGLSTQAALCEAKAQKMLEKCMGAEQERGAGQIVMGHYTAWSRYG